MNNILVKLFGWPAIILQRDPSVFDRWLWMRKHLKRGDWRTLDAGCGAGEFTLYASRIGNRAIGLSFDESLNEIGRTRAKLLGLNAEFLQADLRQLDQLSERLGKFDQIICFETIEHILNDEKLVRDLANLLQPGGSLLLTAPFKDAKHSPGEKLSTREDGGHVRWGYTHAEICLLCDRSGLPVVERVYLTGIISQLIIHWTQSSKDSLFARLITYPLRGFVPLDRWLTRALNYPFSTIAAIGLKPDP
jgi:SAM-dependent methyltransferase